MNTIGIGTDIIEISRIAQMIEKHNGTFLERVFTTEEIRYCSERSKASNQHFAGRWAAKEAALKALGTGWAKGILWTDMEVVNEASGRPRLNVSGAAKSYADELGITHWNISISHCRDFAIAFVTATAESS